MKIIVSNNGNHSHLKAFTRCPHCGREAVFEKLGEHDTVVTDRIVTGQRKCPNPTCRGHLFVVFMNDSLVASYPPVTLDFDTTNIPARISQSFREAIKCHSTECFVASAIMVRRTLEEICEDKAATGVNLKARIADLRGKIVLPEELLEAMDELRLLGNDAAHIEAKEYDQIGKDELEAAIALTKEIMKGMYQYSSLLKRLRALKEKNG